MDRTLDFEDALDFEDDPDLEGEAILEDRILDLEDYALDFYGDWWNRNKNKNSNLFSFFQSTYADNAIAYRDIRKGLPASFAVDDRI